GRATGSGRIESVSASRDRGSPAPGHEGPVQFQKMPKPPGWQEEQAVEIRRDWIAYLADGMGIDDEGVTSAELEALVVGRMLEQAEDDLFEDSFDEWDTEDEEEEDRLHSHSRGDRKQPEQRKGTSKKRRSRSASRTRDRDLSSAGPHGSAGDSGDRTKKRHPRGGVLGSKLLRRSQTTGDMDLLQPEARSA
ncbi:unnamed protein product, partial [Scytosiphon promiscuus]